MDALARMLTTQLEMQQTSYDLDPRMLVGDELADFLTWNFFALEDELHEAMQEFKWKPWLTDGSRGLIVDRQAFIGEMVDAWHFFMNTLLAVSSGHEPEEIAEEFALAYERKVTINKMRQLEGYDGVKDENGRAIDV